MINRAGAVPRPILIAVADPKGLDRRLKGAGRLELDALALREYLVARPP